MRVFGNEIRNNIIDMSMANDEENQLLEYIREFKSKTKPNCPELKKMSYIVQWHFLKGKKWYLKHLKPEYF